MELSQIRRDSGGNWLGEAADLGGPAQLVFVFGSGNQITDDSLASQLKERWPGAALVGCSTAGEIEGSQVHDDCVVASAVRFKHTNIEVVEEAVPDGADSAEIGRQLAKRLPTEGLKHVLLFSDGLHVNGSALVAGMLPGLPGGVTITGGLAGDGARFEHTQVFTSDGAKEQAVVAVGLYGDHIRIGYGSLGGWDPFGPQRVVTRSTDNVLLELDEQPALTLYKSYLGDKAAELPASGLLFPLSVEVGDGQREVVRTILAVDDDENSLTFAGDVPQGAKARLMKANFDRLVDGAQGAAQVSHDALSGGQAELALLISCVGRKLVLKQRTEDELEAVQEIIGDQAMMAGFYSYGEICPAAPDADCDLHNQTMTITTLREE